MLPDGVTTQNDDVRTMMRLYSQDVPHNATVPNEATRLRCARIVLEETLELLDALGVTVWLTPAASRADVGNIAAGDGGRSVVFGDIALRPDPRPPAIDVVAYLANVAKEATDVIVVAQGTLAAHGLPDEPFWAAVRKHNYVKADTGSLDPTTGKFCKAPNFPPLDVRPIVRSVIAGQCHVTRTE